MIKAAVIIPSRFGSSRFPGKPLALILGKPLLRWVYEAARQAKLVDCVLIATDDLRVYQSARSFGAEVVMTKESHTCGTERVAEVAENLPHPIIINLQGDEPLVTGTEIDLLIEALQDDSLLMASLMTKVKDVGRIEDPNLVKVVVDTHGFALYFSRSPLPYQADDFFFLHDGVYGYRKDFLLRLSRLPVSRLERLEKLEQLRVLENGGKIRMIETSHPALRVDTPQDIIRIEEFLRTRQE